MRGTSLRESPRRPSRNFFKSTANEDVTWPFHFDTNLSEEENRLLTGIRVANRQIFERSTRSREYHGMGTTVVGAMFSPPEVPNVHRPRGRLALPHRVRSGLIQLLTRDHSLVNDYLLAMPDLTEEQRNELPKNVITRALGMQDQVVVDLQHDDPHSGDVYVLCSDGLSGMVTDDENSAHRDQFGGHSGGVPQVDSARQRAWRRRQRHRHRDSHRRRIGRRHEADAGP